jgi:hypothetical protein
MIPVGVDHRDLQAVHQADGVHPHFSVLKPGVCLPDGRAFKDAYRILEGDPVALDVAAVLFFILRISHIYTM